jgi:hypothetical protein
MWKKVAVVSLVIIAGYVIFSKKEEKKPEKKVEKKVSALSSMTQYFMNAERNDRLRWN